MDFKKNKVAQNNGQTVKPNGSIANGLNKPVSVHTANNVASNAANNTANNVANKTSANSQTHGKKKEKKNNKTIMYTTGIFVVLIIVLVVVIIAVNAGQNNSGEEVDVNRDTRLVTNSDTTTEDEDQITKEVLEHYAEVKVVGYQEIESEDGAYGAIEIDVKNISDKKISLAVDVVAKDKDGNVLDKTSLYAEEMELEQSYTFNVFSNSELSKEQLQNATVEVLRAYTYGTEESDTNGEVTDVTN